MTTDASWARKTEPVTLTINDGDSVWGEDKISRHITNLTGVKLMLQSVYKDPEVLLTSGETTDFMIAYMEKETNLLTDEAVSQPPDSLSKEFCPDFGIAWTG